VNHVFRVTAVARNACDRTVNQTQVEMAATAGIAVSAVPAVPADSDAVANLPALDPAANCIHHTCDFVSRDARILNIGEQTFLGNRIAVTDTTRLHLHAHITRSGLRNFAFDDLKWSLGFGNLHCAHFCHDSSERIGTSIVLS